MYGKGSNDLYGRVTGGRVVWERAAVIRTCLHAACDIIAARAYEARWAGMALQSRS